MRITWLRLSVACLSLSGFALLVSCGGGSPTPAPVTKTAPVQAPTVTLSSSASSVTQGSAVTLTWSSANASSVSIDNGVGMEPTSGSVSVTPAQATTYTATATGAGGQASSAVTISVNAPAKVVSSIVITSASNELQVGASQQLQAAAIFNDGSKVDVATQVNCTSSNPAVVTVAPGALISAVNIGNATLSCSADNVSASYGVRATAPPVNVLTWHNNDARLGLNSQEIILNPSNVNKASFGKKFSYAVDGEIYAQPLYMANLSINGAKHDVVFVVTEHDNVYAFDADGFSSTPIWQKNLGTFAPSPDTGGVFPDIGITSTPVIDPASGIMYLVTDTFENGGRVFRLHALDITSGNEKLGGPVVVTATVPGTGVESVNGNVTLGDGCYQRAGLALGSSSVYLAFGHCPHGWMLAYDKSSLSRTAVFNTTPNGSGGAIWMSGAAPALDAAGNPYVITGVDAGDASSGFNDSFIKFSPTLTVLDFFTPSNEAFLRANDLDLGSGGPIIMPDNSSAHPHELIGGGKDGRLFVLDRDNLGKVHSPDQALQVVQAGVKPADNIFDAPAYGNGILYNHSEDDVLKAYSWTNGVLSSSPVASGSAVYGVHGASPSISSNGTANGIVWEIEATNQLTHGPAVLHAYDAANVATELYNSSQAGARDTAGLAVKFTLPTVVNGKVFVGTGNRLDVYGLLEE